MRVLHLSLFDRRGGACIAAYRQHLALLRNGVDSQMLVRFKVTGDPAVFDYAPPSSPLIRLRRTLRRHYLNWQQLQSGVHGEFFDDRSEYGGAEMSAPPRADVLNLQFSPGFIDQPSFFQSLPATMPVVVSMHEMSQFTGGCSYAGTCRRYYQQCGLCPLMGGKSEQDISRQVWKRKHTGYGRKPRGLLHFVADSHWLAAEAKKSGLLAGYPVSVIHYGLDTDVFRPMERTVAREIFKVPQDLPVVSFAAASVNDTRKGVRYLIEALNGMQRKPFLLTWGNELPLCLEGFPHLHLGNIASEHLMAVAYNASDVFVMPSLEEAFGQTALEAMSCGVPVAAFSAGGIPDMVRHEETGLLVPVADAQALQAAIVRLLEDRDLRDILSRQARHVAESEFSMEINARRYTGLYQTLLDSVSQFSDRRS